ncbi:MAG: family metalloprotease domain protein [Bacteroidetes bacterium]|nr:family metalloprotease domain protein [Bacteroidota bacterium]
MKLAKKFLGLILLLTSFSYITIGAPADNTQIFSKKQTNGKIISYTLNGDEFISWATSLDGYTLLGNSNGDIVYAVINEEGQMVKSNVLACDYQYRTIEDNIFLSSIKKGLFYNSSQIERFEQNRAQRYSNNSRNNTPTTGTPNFLVILVSFSDIPFNSANVTTMQNQISQTNYTTNGATGSVKDYFFDNSMGILNANFTVVGPYTLSQNQAYYGANTDDNDIRPREMVAEACSLANPNVNFANFDNDNDGIVDMIHVIYAGRGEHNGGGTDAIWAHSWALSTPTNFDGVNVYNYSCSNELRTTTAVDGIGTICHEMGHVLGLPDFYDTDYEGSGGQSIHLSSWDLMAGGSYNNSAKTPPYLSALERQILGWSTPISLTESTSNCTLPAISDSNKAYKVVLSENEFFMFEHRNNKKWDAYIPAKGMLVFHGDNNLINPWLTSGINDINVDPYDRGYFIVPAVGDSTNINSTSTTFPGSTNQTTFINSTLKNGTPTGKSLVGIAYGADSVITFSYVNNTPTITTLPPTNITTTTATLNGNVTGSGITSKGFEYRALGTTNFTQQAVVSNPLQLTLNNLSINTTYEYRIYVTTSFGTIYSPIETFTTDCGSIINPPFTESFDASFTCWNQTSSDTNHFNVVTSGSSPSCSPHSGAKMLKYNSYNIYDNNWTALFTPKINFNSNNSYNVNFWIYRTNGTYSNQQEGIEIYLSSSQTLNSANLIGFISNDRTATPSMSSDGWYNFSCSLPSSTTGNNYLIFKAISGYGYNIYIDDISITQTAITSPTISYNSTSNITHNSATFNASYTQGAQTISSKGFKYKSQNDANWTTLQNLSTTSPFNANVNNLNPNTTYHVKSYITTQTNTYESAIDTFTTLPLIFPIVSTDSATLSNSSSAILYGTYTQGTYSILTSGFQYKKSNSSTWTTIYQTTNNPSFSNTINNLDPNTTYQYKAFVSDITALFYGETKSFTTPIVPPTVVTNTPTTISYSFATLNGTIIEGSETITSQGFEYKLASASTWTSVTTPINGNAITYILNAAIYLSTYECRAFATTASATYYGEIIPFTTLDLVPPTVITNPGTPTSGTTATISGTITAGTEPILAQGFEWKQTNSSQWEEVSATLNGDAITFDLTNLIPEQSYQFKARATTASGVTYGLIETFTTLGLIEVERKEISIIIYPNPTNSTSNLKIENVYGNIKIRITDISGRVLQKIEENVNNGYETQIDLSNYSKGVYFINITTDKSQRTEKLILK